MTAAAAADASADGTTGPAPRRDATDPAPRWGTARTVLRVHRTALAVWGLAVLGLTGWLVWLTEVTADEARARQEACHLTAPVWCDPTYGTGYDLGSSLDLAALLTAHAFLAVAAFAGGALIGRELENRTAHLAWTQGVSPVRWLGAKLAVAAFFVALGTTTPVLVFRWVRTADEDLLVGTGWTADHMFAAGGPVTVAYALCALALGTLTALLLRRALPALGVSVAATWLLGLFLAAHRASLWPAASRFSATRPVEAPDSAWALETGALVHGRRVPDVQFWRCESAAEVRSRCLDDLGVTGFYTTYHPTSHFWPLQLVETAIVLVVAALATTAAFRLLKHRTA
ncbi:hypothetical protein [Streptomyces sp. NPDC088812]|uniref:hypothetical protein n=1 Tax=Streptomyces sp. NPDC088812 TaxID=3365905 RepID=UPI00380D8B8D